MYVAFVDFRKAFDMVNRNAMWKILQQYGIHGNMYRILQAMYRNVTCCVQSRGQLSEYFLSTVGVKQGCNLSPLIFSCIINELAKNIINRGKHGVQLMSDSTQLFLLLFADDMVLLSDTPTGLQKQSSVLECTSGELGLSVNIDKTRVMVCRLGGHLARNEKWFFSGKQIHVVKQYEYLDFTFSSKLCTNNYNTIRLDRQSKGRPDAND